MTAPWRPQAFPVQVPPSFRAHRVLRSSGTACPTGPGGYSQGSQHYPGERPILYDSYDEMRAQDAGPAVPHHAMDITCAEGSYVVASNAGIIPPSVHIKGEVHPGAGTSPKGGNYVFVRDDQGYTQYYAHLLRLDVRPGQRVAAGEVLGLCGRTGNAAGGCPHCHFAVTDPSGAKLNPYSALLPGYLANGWKRAGVPTWIWWLTGTAAAGVAITWLLRKRK